MINTVLIDDEYLAIEKFKHQLKQLDEINVVDTFTNPEIALEYIFENNNIHLVIVDIQMPQMTGLQFSKSLALNAPWVKIVFSTAYEEYALEAFELDACDYLLKPSSMDRIKQMINKVKAYQTSSPDEVSDEIIGKTHISLFKHFELQVDHNIIDITWRTAKVKELFMYFLCHINVPIRKEYLIEVLWPEYSLKSGIPLLNTTMYNLRKNLKPYKLDFNITYATGSYTAKLGSISLDIDELSKFDTINNKSSYDIETINHISKIYKGHLLEIEGYGWTDIIEQNFLSIYRNMTLKGLEYYLKTKDQKGFKYIADSYIAVDYYDDGIWEFYLKGLMQFGNITKAMSIYIEYKKSLYNEYQVAPSFKL